MQWDGVAFADFFDDIVAPALPTGTTVTHIVFGGHDGFESVLQIEDALSADVLLADHLDGHPLTSDHGTPVRLVSPQQYGYMNTKHLSHITLHSAAPSRELGAAHPISKVGLRGPLVTRHPRARVWQEERHPSLPARWLRGVYRLTIAPGIWLGALAGRQARDALGSAAFRPKD